MLSQVELEKIFTRTGVLQEGHFLLSSGLHSSWYMQCAQLLQYPEEAEKVCRSLAELFVSEQIEVVVGPALGGVIVAYETARALKAKNIHAEREKGVMTFRRGFTVKPGERVLIVEDVVTTGGSVREVLQLVQSLGADIKGVAAIVDRSGGNVDFGVPFHALYPFKIKSYPPDECPMCKEGSAAIKPGSRTGERFPT